jgi:thymidine kinase
MGSQGKLIFKYGTMKSGKSLHLLATAHNFNEHSIPFLIFKSKINDERINSYEVLGNKVCVMIDTNDNLYRIITKYIESLYYTGYENPKWILVDEAQFLTKKQVEELAAIADNFGISIICYGLRTDFQTNLFEGSKRLFELADSFEEIKTSCPCNHKTIFNIRRNKDNEIITDGKQIEIGNSEKYDSICRKCYFTKVGHYLYNNENNLD